MVILNHRLCWTGLALTGWALSSFLPAAVAQPAGDNLHSLHVRDQGLTCESCHAPGGPVGAAACTDCHDAEAVSGLLRQFAQDVATQGPPAPPPDHAQDFRRAHGQIASVDPRRCAACHQESYCQECHEGENLQGRIHPLNFVQTHPFEALGQETDCLVCHETREFCTDCHSRSLALTHPLGPAWANSGTGGAHAAEAESNLESCLSCHDLGADDLVCSRPGCHQ